MVAVFEPPRLPRYRYTDDQKRRMWQTTEYKNADQADLVRTVRAVRTGRPK